MTLKRTFKGLALATALSLFLAAPAIGVPAGDEYLPQVPSATGDKPVSENPDASAGEGDSNGNGNGKGDRTTPRGDDEENQDAGALASSGGGDDDSGGVLDTLLDPIVLLLIGGVLTIAIGLMLARKQNGDSPDPSKARRASSDAPLPPDGEIVGGAERP